LNLTGIFTPTWDDFNNPFSASLVEGYSKSNFRVVGFNNNKTAMIGCRGLLAAGPAKNPEAHAREIKKAPQVTNTCEA
jgi:hypothetical protein